MGEQSTQVPFKNSGVRLSDPQDFPLFKVSFFHCILNITWAELEEDGPTRPGGRGWQGTRRLINKEGSKVFRKGVSNFDIVSQYFSPAFYGIYAGGSWVGPLYVGTKTLLMFADFPLSKFQGIHSHFPHYQGRKPSPEQVD